MSRESIEAFFALVFWSDGKSTPSPKFQHVQGKMFLQSLALELDVVSFPPSLECTNDQHLCHLQLTQVCYQVTSTNSKRRSQGKQTPTAKETETFPKTKSYPFSQTSQLRFTLTVEELGLC